MLFHFSSILLSSLFYNMIYQFFPCLSQPLCVVFAFLQLYTEFMLCHVKYVVSRDPRETHEAVFFSCPSFLAAMWKFRGVNQRGGGARLPTFCGVGDSSFPPDSSYIFNHAPCTFNVVTNRTV